MEVRAADATERSEGDPFEVLREMLAEHTVTDGAAAGYLGYWRKRHVERLPDTVTPDDLGLPECHLAFYERLHESEAGDRWRWRTTRRWAASSRRCARRSRGASTRQRCGGRWSTSGQATSTR